MHPKNESAVEDIISTNELKMLTQIKNILQSTANQINLELDQQGLRNVSGYEGIDVGYISAVLHQSCFAWLHDNDKEVAIWIAENQVKLAHSL
ncbi:hypothetical protein BFW87_11480 [Pseudomonas fluorescens]|jgi:hypothetical protein|uniref:Uncharacterized protein n=2 Tax=Pseudomonas fluorescens TaxID=294 RepID=A0A1T2YX22_PSEFL|nr:hypothetical protein BFW87_11480 [Pseudomonas fluorescens]